MDTKNWKVVSILDPDVGDLIELYHSERWGRQLWRFCKVRKKKSCLLCGRVLMPSTKDNEAYRPMPSKKNQGDRICIPCMGQMVKPYLEGRNDGDKS